MPIEISTLTNSHTSAANEGSRTHTPHRDPAATNQEADTPSLVDTVSITETASQLQLMGQEIANTPEVNLERVEHMRGLLNSGEYEVDASHVADKILHLETQL